MAIAPLVLPEDADCGTDPFDVPWPRPQLQIVPERGEPGLRAHSTTPFTRITPMVRTGMDVTHRRARRAIMLRRRRRLFLGITAAVLAAGLALPLSVLAGAPVSAGAHGLAARSPEAVYVVRPGDTMWSIAERFERGGDTRSMAAALARETGSDVVVPGERIAIP